MKRLLPIIPLILLLAACSGEGEKQKAPEKPVVVLKAYSVTLHDRIEALGTANASESVDIAEFWGHKLNSRPYALALASFWINPEYN